MVVNLLRNESQHVFSGMLSPRCGNATFRKVASQMIYTNIAAAVLGASAICLRLFLIRMEHRASLLDHVGPFVPL